LLRSRIAARRGDASDANEAVMLRAVAADPGPLDGWVRVDASADPVPAALASLGVGVR
jgi:predicted kinase